VLKILYGVCLDLSLVDQFWHNSLLKSAPRSEIAKKHKTPYFGGLRLFEVIDMDSTKKLVTSACCDKQQYICAYVQPLFRV